MQHKPLVHDNLLTIAIARSRKSAKWINKTIKWSALLAKLSETTYTSETLEEYKKLPKAEQDNIKDVGGFVGGTLINERRRRENIKDRTLITLDLDYAIPGIFEIVSLLYGFAFCIYSTHKHSPEKPRLRLLIPLKRPVTSEEYQAVSRYIAGSIGMDYFDITTFEPSRLMYWPSTSRDGEYEFKWQDGEWLNPDEVLGQFENWRDIATWPEKLKIRVPQTKTNESRTDPSEKNGLIGAFLRAYPIPRAIEKFLSNIYVPCSEEGRYTYAKGSTTGGLIVYDEGYSAFSFHGTDPAGGKVRNSFDLVRIHKFGSLDEKKCEDAEVSKLPSFKEMMKLCSRDGNVKEAMIVKNFEAGIDDKSETEKNPPQDMEWARLLEIDEDGKIISKISNIELILQNDINLKERIAYNMFSHKIMIRENLLWHELEDREEGDTFGDFDISGLRGYLETYYGISSVRKTEDALFNTSKKNEYHPIRQYFDTLAWDGTKRVEKLFIDYLGAEDCEFIRTVTKKTLAAAVARIMSPGIKFDYMLVLLGKQGIGKSQIIDRLGKRWFSDSITTLQGKESFEQLQGKWILEFAELSAIRKSEQETVKHFVSKRIDSYRPAYGRHTIDCPRQCIFLGTTNEEEFLKDKTGNRKFWPVKVGVSERNKNIKDLTEEIVDQIWAEALEIWNSGETLYLTEEMEEEALRRQMGHTEKSPMEGPIREYLELPLPVNWDSMNISARRRFIHGREFSSSLEGKVKRERVCAAEIWVELFEGEQRDLKQGKAKEINDILRNIEGWEKYSKSEGRMKFGKNYGLQTAFIRKNPA